MWLCRFINFLRKELPSSTITHMDSHYYHLFLLLSICFLLELPRIESSVITCPPLSCSVDSQPVHFPFRLMTSRLGQGPRCGFPAFGLSCNNQSQTLLNLPGSGDFSVQHIDYKAQTVWLNDPYGCLPGRLLNFSLSGSPLREAHAPRSFTFLNCSSLPNGAISPPVRPVPCREGQNYTVVYALTSRIHNWSYMGGCEELGTVMVPVPLESGSDLGEGVLLKWDTPNCKSCLARGGVCGRKSGSNLEIGCTNIKSQGLPRSAKYGIIIGVGIPGLLCLIGFACYIGGRVSAYARWHQRADYPDHSAPVARPLELHSTRGLDGPTIESYPKTLLGESRRLPKPNDNTCPICLSEYRSKETLRTIPECSHYFHADCIDQWLKMNSTCPLCRNSPCASAAMTPSESTSTSTSSSSRLMV
ncbi:putative RING-H2 finger protein ATL21B isoform X2 [Punica granatum]|uniref:RING-type E3 ubiquitin transferase n=2 Tax=Punica granatum TaxID=22663 RepID=A0A6P8DC87_PUNGR|nr:putative RING-H2 finger protein ATL21B isoform X2 [Punica granatum]